ncbi:uncharacterized protein LOC110185506 [Drosophila serrata]|uniref:uncharacterized protein LOC110185506 n=1 Tax=Drosophila serrata TaxID=7274 RepID=UPI000A1D177A|nr:uncharacterized protein LOC110185506 [Drosophila serrata]
MEKVLETYAGNRTLGNGEMFVMGNYYCPLMLLLLWMASIGLLICTFWYCKFVRSETVTTFDSSSFELQEVSVLQHNKGCTCLDCLHRQLNQELELKNTTKGN